MIVSDVSCEACFVIDKKGNLIAAIDEKEAICADGYKLLISNDPENDFIIRRNQFGQLQLIDKASIITPS